MSSPISDGSSPVLWAEVFSVLGGDGQTCHLEPKLDGRASLLRLASVRTVATERAPSSRCCEYHGFAS